MGGYKERPDDIAWFWYEKVQEFLNQDLSPKIFCKKYKINLKQFCDYKFSILNVSKTDPTEYQKRKEAYEQYRDSGMHRDEFSKLNNVKLVGLKSWVSHFVFLEQIERIKKQKELSSDSNPMSFIQVPSVVPKQDIKHFPVTQELLTKQHDLEITSSRGIKVIITPELSSSEIIKLIEFLRTL
jgi:hypothetical protein